MTDIERLQIAFDLLWAQHVIVSKQLERERQKSATLIRQNAALIRKEITDAPLRTDQVISISR